MDEDADGDDDADADDVAYDGDNGAVIPTMLAVVVKVMVTGMDEND